MAPGKRPKKGDTRMDAAIDHMNTLGFPQDLVRRKMKNLLQVYGGEWVFIEADNYAVLLEAILEEVEKPAKENDDEDKSKQGEYMMMGNPALQNEKGENPEILPSFGSSSAAVEEPICDPEFINTSTHPVVNTGGLVNPISMSMSIEEGGKDCSNLEKTDGGVANIIQGEVRIGNNTTAAPLEANPQRGRRKPCYGWISDEEEEDDFVYLTPAPRFTTTGLPSVARDVKATNKQNTRRDVKPQGFI